MAVKKCILSFFLFAGFSSFAEEASPKNEELAKISEAMGHLIGKNLQSLGLTVDVDALVRGMQEASQGKESPLTEEACMDALSHLQEEALLKTADKNLEEANRFLQENKTKEGIISLVNEKLQYEVVKKGDGQAIESYSRPLVRYSGKCLSGPSIPLTEELLDLDETVLGFQKGLVGMKEGEIRTLYIHPEFGYGKDPYPSPNSLLIFEVEVIKADAGVEANAASNFDTIPKEINNATFERVKSPKIE